MEGCLCVCVCVTERQALYDDFEGNTESIT